MLTINLLANVVFKPLLLVGLGWALFRQERRRSASHQHLLFSALLLCLPLALVANLVWQPLALYLPWPGAGHWLTQPWQSLLSHPWTMALLALYLFGLLFNLFYLALGLLLLARIERDAEPAPAQARLRQLCALTGVKPLSARQTHAVSHPQVWRLVKPVILLPRQFCRASAAEQDLMLLHELGHVARRDWLLSMAARLVCALFWFLPPVWWLASALRQMAERATDDWVLALDHRPADYADLLLRNARALRQDLPSQALNGSPLFERIHWLLDELQDRDQRAASELTGGLLVLTLLIGLLSAVHWALRPAPAIQQVQWTLMPTEIVRPAATENPAKDAQIATPPQVQLRRPITDQHWLEQLHVIAEPGAPVGADIRIGRPDAHGLLPLSLVTPGYPRRAVARNIQGLVRLQFDVDADGYARHIQVLESPSPLLSRAAIEALRASRYAAPRLNGQPVALTQLTEDYRFTLHPPDR